MYCNVVSKNVDMVQQTLKECLSRTRGMIIFLDMMDTMVLEIQLNYVPSADQAVSPQSFLTVKIKDAPKD